MKLITAELAKKLPALGSTDGKGAEAVALVKLFHPCGRFTLFVTEYDPVDRLLYGYCLSPLGQDCDEWGYTSLDELEQPVTTHHEATFHDQAGPGQPFKTTERRDVAITLAVERDLYWKPKTVREACIEAGAPID